MSTSSSPRIPPLSELSLASPSLSPTSSAFLSLDRDPANSPPSATTTPAPRSDPSDPDFEYGEHVYYRRRQAWLATGTPHVPAEPTQEESGASSTGSSMSRLEALLDGPQGSDVDDLAWRSGLEGVHRGLLGGRRLVKRMKLGLVIKVLRAGWIRDGTWPASLPPVPPSPPWEHADLPSPPTLQHGSSTTTPVQSPPTSINLPLPPALSALRGPNPADVLSPGSASATSTTTATTIDTPGTAETTPDIEGPPAPPAPPALAPSKAGRATKMDQHESPPKIRSEEDEGEGTPTDQAGTGV